MTNLFVQFLLLVVFSFALAATVSGYRDDEPHRILRGTLRRAALFGGAVIVLGVAAILVDHWFLRP